MQSSSLRTWESLAVYCGTFVVFQIFIFQIRSSLQSGSQSFDTKLNSQSGGLNDLLMSGFPKKKCQGINKEVLRQKIRARGSPRNITAGEARRCFRNTTFYFLGDSQQRNLYSALIALLKGLDTFRMSANATPDYYFDENIHLLLRKNITKTLNKEAVRMMEEIEAIAENSPAQRIVVIQGYSMWYSYWNPNNSIQDFIADLEESAPAMNKLKDFACHIWMPQPPLNLDKQVKWLTQMLDSQMSEINEIAKMRLGPDVIYWEGSRINAVKDIDDYYDFAHPGYRILLQDWYDLHDAFGCI